LKKYDDKSAGTHLHHSLAKEISGMKGSSLSTEEAVMCVAESLLYEKTNDGGYIHGKAPEELCKYLETFKHEDTNIIEGPSIGTCKGCTGPHPFLDAKGVHKNVKYPVLPTSALYVSQPDFNRVHMVKVERLQDLILDEKVPLDNAIGSIGVLAAYTRVPARRKGERLSYKHVLPSNIVNITSGSCVHTGEQLCWRGLQHALDAGTPDILVGDVNLAKYDGRTCAIINNEILASMKSILYCGKSAFNETELLATSCPCRAGCKNKSLD
jgi:hypothetical protein